MNRCALLLVLGAWLMASDMPLDRSAYANAAEQVAALLAQHDIAAADTAGQLVEARGWNDGRANFPADPAFAGTHWDGERRQDALRTLAVLLRETGPSALVPDADLLQRLHPPAPAGTLEGDDLSLPELPDTWTSFVIWLGHKASAALRWIGECINDFLRWLVPPRADGKGVDITQLAIGGCLVLVTAIVCVVTVLWWRRRRTTTNVTLRDDHQLDEAIDRPVSEWEQRAEQLLASGDHRGAIRASFHAALAAAFASGHLHHRRGRTNWEYVAQVPSRATWRTSLVGLVATFERSWYGGHDTSAEDCRRFRSDVAGLAISLRDMKASA